MNRIGQGVAIPITPSSLKWGQGTGQGEKGVVNLVKRRGALFLSLALVLFIGSCGGGSNSGGGGNFTGSPPLPSKPVIHITDSVSPISDKKIAFGRVISGNSSDQVITIKNIGRADLVLSPLSALPLPFSVTYDKCTDTTLLPLTACTLSIRFKPTANAVYSETLTITSNDSGNSDLHITLTGEGVVLDSSNVSLSGKITFEAIPVTREKGVSYDQSSFKPARGVLVEALTVADSTLVSSTTTDSQGNYTLTVPSNTRLYLLVQAQMLKVIGPPTWDYRVVDNTRGKSLYAMSSAPFNSENGLKDKNLKAGSGWDGTQYSGDRTAAPFAILDVLYETIQLTISADPTIDLKPLSVNWSTNNVPSAGNPELGQINWPHYSPKEGAIYLLGAEDVNTDEYDRHLIAHEWGHYLIDQYSRNDSIGGFHSLGDRLDARVAYSEGLATALAVMALEDTLYIDTYGKGQQSISVSFDVEDNSVDENFEGWFNESSVQIILYDLFDSTNEGVDGISLGFTPLYNLLAGPMKTTDSFTTLLSFLTHLKKALPDSTDSINALMAGEGISTTFIDEWDSTGQLSKDGGNIDGLPLYGKLGDGGPPLTLCTNNLDGSFNKLANNRFFYVEITSQGTYTFTVDPISGGDPVIILYSPSQTLGWSNEGEKGIRESLTFKLPPGFYWGEIYDYNMGQSIVYKRECFHVSYD